MVKVNFITANDERVEAEAAVGDNLLRLGQAAGMPLEGTCEGQMACSTCHVIVAPEDFARLPRATEDEDDLLDLAVGVTRTSRLACQISVPAEGLTVRMPPSSLDWRRG